MTTDNPDPLEVWNKAVDAYDERLFGIPSPGTRADRTAARQAAAAIIAQHYAPLVAENARLRDELNQYRHVMERLRDFDGWVGTYHAGHAYDAKQDALALLGAKP